MDIDIKKKSQIIMPILCLKGVVMFPQMILHFDIGREDSISAIEAGMIMNRTLFVIAQRDIDIDVKNIKELYSVGTVIRIKHIFKNADGSVRILAEGIFRATLDEIYSYKPHIEAGISKILETEINTDISDLENLVRLLQKTFKKYVDVFPKIPKNIIKTISNKTMLKDIFNIILQNVNIGYTIKQKILEEKNTINQIQILIKEITNEIDMIKYEKKIYDKVKTKLDTSQKNYFLREQIKVMSDELMESEGYTEEVHTIEQGIKSIKKISKESKEKLLKECKKLAKSNQGSHEANIIRSYLETCLELPWDKKTRWNIDINKSKGVLEESHYGLKKVKERMMEFLAVRKLAPDIKGQIICLVGPPGVGKTSIAKALAKSMDRKWSRVSLGGIRDESDIRGHRKTYVGAMPGRIINAMIQAKVNNPVLILDEIDKMGSDFKGDPSSAMLEVLDSEQNTEFRDHYIEVGFDISNAIFIATANNLSDVPAALRDRMEVIELSSYTRDEKFNISKNHLIDKQIKRHGLKNSMIKIEDNCIYSLIDYYTRESGVRNLEREIAAICRKVANKIVMKEEESLIINEINIESYLGNKKYLIDEMSTKDEIGVCNGLAWTSVGGDTLKIEVIVVKGKGILEITGNLGDVMKESTKTAVSYVRSVADKYNIEEDFYKTKDIHIHFPAGATPKDGPSAGITITTGIISALTERSVKKDIAMTGEVSLRGMVLPIGGLKEKSMAAHRLGIKKVIIPKLNLRDLDEIDSIIKDEIDFIAVENVEEVLEIALN